MGGARPEGRSTYPRAEPSQWECTREQVRIRPDAYGGLRRSRAALAPALEGRKNRAKGDLLKGYEVRRQRDRHSLT